MLSLFSIPKPFIGRIGIIQKNAITSWRHIHPGCEILLFGDEPGTADIAREFGLRHIPEVMKNEYHTPLLHKIFADANRLASYEWIGYVNSDIIILNSLIATLELIRFSDFLVSGQRWSLDISTPINFAANKWNTDLYRLAREKGTLDSPYGMDYFIFPRDSKIIAMPPFVVGRPYWDNWIVFRARQLKIPVIDATTSIPIIHQNHDYAHVPNRREYRWDGPEADQNLRLMGDLKNAFTLLDATHIVQGKKIKRALLRRHWQKATILYPSLTPWILSVSRMLNRIRSLGKLFKKNRMHRFL